MPNIINSAKNTTNIVANIQRVRWKNGTFNKILPYENFKHNKELKFQHELLKKTYEGHFIHQKIDFKEDNKVTVTFTTETSKRIPTPKEIINEQPFPENDKYVRSGQVLQITYDLNDIEQKQRFDAIIENSIHYPDPIKEIPFTNEYNIQDLNKLDDPANRALISSIAGQHQPMQNLTGNKEIDQEIKNNHTALLNENIKNAHAKYQDLYDYHKREAIKKTFPHSEKEHTQMYKTIHPAVELIKNSKNKGISMYTPPTV